MLSLFYICHKVIFSFWLPRVCAEEHIFTWHLLDLGLGVSYYYCIIVARFLTIMYTNQTFRVLLCSHLTNGVKQRGVMYPLLFTVYVIYCICYLAEYGPRIH